MASILFFVTTFLIFAPLISHAHCDTMDGPVVADAKKALESGDVTPALKWVSVENEPEIISTFKKVLNVRGENADARELADMYFFEALVRLHRAGEGAPYTGLKSARSDMHPAVAASDKALESGSVDILVGKITDLVATGIQERFERAIKTRAHKDDSIDSGREYVESYVTFVHYVERIHQDASAGEAHHEHSE